MTQAMDQFTTQPVERVTRVPSRADVRLPGIDRLRGLVILLMALDHVRDFFNADALYFAPTDLARTYPALFLTRFITHYCAPTFVFLAGASAFLHGTKLDDRRALARFLITRGAWLILLDIVVVSPVWGLELGLIYLATLWAIGFSMIVLAGLVFVPPRAVLLTGVLVLLGHNLLDPAHASAFENLAPLWTMLHEPGALPFGLHGWVSYPVLPWIGIMAVGYGLGHVFLEPATKRERQLTVLGLAAIALFLLLRGITLGPIFLLLPAMERLGGFVGEVLATYGRVPLFIYLLHLYVARAAAVALWLVEGFDFHQLHGFGVQAAGLSLAGTYAAWILIMAALYPACRWYAGVKQRRRDWWLSYL